MLPVDDIVHVLPTKKETPARNCPEAEYHVEDVSKAIALLAVRDTSELKFTVLLITEKSLKVQIKPLGEVIADEVSARVAKHALPLALPSVLAVEVKVTEVPEMLR